MDQSLEQRLKAVTAEVSDALGVQVRAALQAAHDRTSDSLEELRSDLESVQSLPQQMARALTMVRDAVTEIAAAQEAVGERIGVLSEELPAKLTEEVSAVIERRLEDRLDAILHLIDARLPEPPSRKRRWWRRSP